MKTKKVRDVLKASSVAHARMGSSEVARALDELSELLKNLDKEEFSSVVARVKELRLRFRAS